MSIQADSLKIAKRYATALIALAEDAKKLDAVSKDLTTLSDIVASSADFQAMLDNPLIKKSDQISAVAAICKKAKISGLVSNFVGTLADNRRLTILSLIMKVSQDMIAKKRGDITAEITTAEKLDVKQIKKLTDSLKKLAGSNVQLNLVVDKEILGGLIVKIGSTMIDHSVRTKLDRLKRAMKSQNVTVQKTPKKKVA